MLSFDTAGAIAAVPTDASIDPALRQLIADRVHDWAATDLLNLTHLLIVGAGDTEDDVVEEVSLSPLVNPLDGQRFGSPGFLPHHDWLEDHGGWFELIFSVGNDGFAFVLFVPDQEGADAGLLSFCRAFARGRSAQ